MGYPLEPDLPAMREMGRATLAFVEDFISRCTDAPAADLEGALDLAATLREIDAPEHGTAFGDLLNVVAAGAAKAVDYAGPGHLAYIPGGGLYASALADFLAAATNRYVTLWALAPAFAQIEWTAVRWLCDLFGYPASARGVLTSGGSMANLAAIVTARHTLLAEDFRSGAIYVTAHVHGSVAKAVHVAGFPRSSVRVVPTDARLRMDAGALAELVRADRRRGLRPCCVVASVGTTNTGAVDPVGELAEVSRAENLWLHVDGAYGGPFQLTRRGQALFRGIEAADSITLDPHKAMFLPYGTGALLVRDGQRLRAAHHHVGADYLQDVAAEDEIPNFSEYSVELSRNFRGLRLWLPIKLHGMAAFRDALDEKLDLAGFLYDELRAAPRFDVPWQPELTTVPFRYQPGKQDPDDFNQRLLDRINYSGRIVMSSTRLDGRFFIRPCVLSHRTHRDRIEEAIQIIRAAATELRGGV